MDADDNRRCARRGRQASRKASRQANLHDNCHDSRLYTRHRFIWGLGGGFVTYVTYSIRFIWGLGGGFVGSPIATSASRVLSLALLAAAEFRWLRVTR